jgi:signal transduction histidine kinase/ActR/RegA family two-component response regulator
MNRFLQIGCIILIAFLDVNNGFGEFSIKNIFNTPEDSIRASQLIHQAETLLEDSPAKSLKLSEQAIELLAKEKNSTNYIKAVFIRGDANSSLENHALALQYFTECLSNSYFNKDTNKLAELKFKIATTYDCLANITKAIQYYNEALQLYQVKSNIYGEAKVLQNIGIIESDLHRDSIAMQYYTKALDLYIVLNNKAKEAAVLQNIGVIYSNQENYSRTIQYYNKALKIFIDLKDVDGIATVENNLGLAYERKLQFNVALSHYKKSMNYFEKINSRTGLAYIHENMASLYRRLNQQDISIKNYELSLKYADSVQIKDFQAYVNKELATYYEELGNFKLALHYYKKGSLIEDSLNIHDSEKKLSHAETQFHGKLNDIEIQKKEFQLVAQKKEKAIYLGGVIILVFLLSALVYAYRKKVKAENQLRKHQEELEQQVQQRTNELQLEMFERKAAEEADKLKTAFLANMSHEIRTPMNAILAFSNFLKDNDITSVQKNEYINYINACGTSLLHLIDDILDTAKIESKQLKINIKQCNLSSILNELYFYFLNHKKCKEGEIKLSIPAHCFSRNYSLETDCVRLRQILTNLLDNAFKFTEKGDIEFGFDIIENMIQFFVRDTGIGIPLEKIDIIFERFGQVNDNSHKVYKGTGLGLSISKNLAELLGGKMWVETNEGVGTCFFFTIPANSLNSTEILTGQESLLTDGHNPTLIWKDYTILVAEDDDLNFKLIQIALQKTKVNVIRANNGQEVLNILDEISNIHAVLMDIQMPVMDGFEATIQLKKRFPQLPVIAQTAFAMSDDKIKCLEVGCDDYISKPLNIDELYLKLDSTFLHQSISKVKDFS